MTFSEFVETETVKTTYEVTVKETCEENGNLRFTATFSADWAEVQTKDVVISATGHGWTVEYSFADDGSTCIATRKCANVEAHNVTAEATITSEVTTPATCTAKGTTTYTAKFGVDWAKAQTKEVVDVPMKEHTSGNAVKENINKATCEADGSYDEVTYCTVCNTKLSSVSQVITKREHVYGDWYYASEADKPTYTKTGTQTRDCQNTESELYAACTHKDTQTVAKVTDETAPTGTITYKTTTWDKFLETITFGIYTSENVRLTIEAADDEQKRLNISFQTQP